MSLGDSVAVGEAVDSGGAPVVGEVEEVAGGPGVADGAPQATSSRIITRPMTSEALIFMSMPPGSECFQAHSDGGYFTIPEKSGIITLGDDRPMSSAQNSLVEVSHVNSRTS